jgi:hypothetical protein
MIIEAKEQEKVIKQELQQKKWKKADPNAKAEAALYNPSMPTADDTEDSTWKERWLRDTRTRQVYTSSKLLSKTKHKMKLIKAVEAAESQQQMAAGAAGGGGDPHQATEGDEEGGGGARRGGREQQGIIGSIEEYASLVGKSVHQLADAKYEVPEVSESEGEESGHSGEEGDSLWGAILGGDK